MTAVVLILLLLMNYTGCATQRYLVQRDTPANPLSMQLNLASRSGPKTTQRTANVLRRFALDEVYKKDPIGCMEAMQKLLDSEMDGELVYGVSEIAYIEAKRREDDRPAEALDLFGVAVSNAYMYLFGNEFDNIRNPYDPQFRGACDLYNQSLEGSLRLIIASGQLKPGSSYEVVTDKQRYNVQTLIRGPWSPEDFESFEFVSEYKIDGLNSSGITYGLGVPLIAVRRKGPDSDPRERYYPNGLSFPVTALLKVVPPEDNPGNRMQHRHHCVLELHDPLQSSDINLGNRLVPLQTDLSTALAYFLDTPEFREKNQATLGLLNPQKSDQYRGISMLEPFDPHRIPVLMVHGLWSSPVTWMPMFNDLRSFPDIRKNYQIWFYNYPTGQPFWLSATQLREELAELRQRLDPDRQYEALNQLVLVGHSMGGLVSRLQTVESRDDFWNILSDKPFEQVQGSPEELQLLRQAAFFRPNQDVRRVITIGTPHRGSDFANDATRWISRQFIQLPTKMVATSKKIIQLNPGVFQNSEILVSSTSIDSLSPDSPVFPAMLRSPRAPWVTYHNIIGMIEKDGWFSKPKVTGDGVVEYESAHMDDVASEISVEAEHSTLHRHPRTTLEVRRVLMEHLASVQSEYRVAQRLAQLEATRQSASGLITNDSSGPELSEFSESAATTTTSSPQMPVPMNIIRQATAGQENPPPSVQR
jgi:pimeloyl-ACP methyl ester carboxylesterase